MAHVQVLYQIAQDVYRERVIIMCVYAAEKRDEHWFEVENNTLR